MSRYQEERGHLDSRNEGGEVVEKKEEEKEKKGEEKEMERAYLEENDEQEEERIEEGGSYKGRGTWVQWIIRATRLGETMCKTA